VTVAGEGEGAVEFGDDVGGAGEQLLIVKRLDEAAGSAHGADGVRAGGTDADLEEVKERGFHDRRF
jgi:hypothetical protein